MAITRRSAAAMVRTAPNSCDGSATGLLVTPVITAHGDAQFAGSTPISTAIACSSARRHPTSPRFQLGQRLADRDRPAQVKIGSLGEFQRRA
jgi:hypothetical protein